MNMVEDILKKILKMKMGETDTFKLSDNRFLFVDNWSVGDGENFTSLELNSGEEAEDVYVLDEVIDCGTYDFRNEAEIRSGIEYMLLCSK